MIENNLLTPKETAEYLKLSIKTLAEWRCRGFGMKFKKIGGKILYSKAEIDQWINEQGSYQSTAEARLKKGGKE